MNFSLKEHFALASVGLIAAGLTFAIGTALGFPVAANLGGSVTALVGVLANGYKDLAKQKQQTQKKQQNNGQRQEPQ